MKKILWLASLTLIASAAVSSAAIVANGCVDTTTAQDGSRIEASVGWLMSGNSCVQKDKQYSGFKNVDGLSGIPVDWLVAMYDDGNDLHSITIQNAGASTLGTGAWGIEYLVDVLDRHKAIREVTVAQEGTGGVLGSGAPNRLATKWVYDTTAGAPGVLLGVINTFTADTLAVSSQHLRIVERIDVKAGRAVTSFTDSYKQSTVPEPATYAMMGLGLAALGLVSRRKKA